MVTLSRPNFPSTPRMVPSTTPGLSAGGTSAAQERTIFCVAASRRATSSPIAAAGTRPKSDRTEYRPPMPGIPNAMCRNRSRSATFCIFDPGSVMAMKRDPTSLAPTARFAHSKKYCFKIFGSSVLPDLLDTMKSVRAGSIVLSIVRICAGSVESSTSSSGRPF